jgi:hypothetical protein
MPPRDPDEDDEDEEDEDRADEPPVVREPDEDQSMISTRKSRQGVPRRLAVASRLRGGLLRRAASNVAVPALPWDARP